MSRFWGRSCVAVVCAGLAVTLGAGAVCAASGGNNKAPVAAAVPWSGHDLTKRHPVIAGEATTLKATASDADGTVVSYSWDFGDGGSTGQLAVIDPRVISAEHTYAGSVGQNLTATLTVWDDKGATGTASYLMTVMADTLEVRNNIAIDKSLWWVHKQLVRYDFNNDTAQPCAYLENNGWNPGMVTDAFALQGFEEQGHLPSSSANTNPYVDDARRLLNQITVNLFVAPSQTKGDGAAFPVVDPDSPDPVTGLKDGLVMGTLEDHFEYEMGPVLKAIVNSGKGADKPAFADETLNATGDPAKSVVNFTYDQIAQNIIDYIAWAQLYDHPNDYNAWQNVCVQDDGMGGCAQWQWKFVGPSKVANVALNPRSRGSWPYWAEGWNDPLTNERGGWGDMALAFWVSLGLQEAKGKKQADGVTPRFTIPQFLNDELALFVSPAAGHQNLDTASPSYGSVYFGPNDGTVYDRQNGYVTTYHDSYHFVERAAELLVVLNYLGVPQDDTRAAAALGFIDRSWGLHNYDIGQTHYSARWDGPIDQVQYRPEGDGVTLWLTDIFNPANYAFGSYGVNRWWGPTTIYGDNYSFFHLYESDGTNVVWGFEEGYWDNGVWVKTKGGDDLNIFALYAVSRALDGYGITDFPGAGRDPEALTWDQRISKLLAANQLPDGGYNEFNWVYGSPFGTPWALMTMMEREAVAADNSMSILSVTFSTNTTKNGTEHLVTKVKVVDSVGAPVAGASVAATLTQGVTLLSEAQLTDANGEAAFDYSQSRQSLAGTYTFVVTGVTKDGLVLSTALPVSQDFTK